MYRIVIVLFSLRNMRGRNLDYRSLFPFISIEMPARRKGKFIKLSEKQRRERCSMRMRVYNDSSNLLNKSVNVQDETLAEFEHSSEQTNQSSCEQVSDTHTVNVSSPADEENSEHLTWRDGRRIVECDGLAEQLKSCWDCGQPLPLHNIVEETRMGFGSILYIDNVFVGY